MGAGYLVGTTLERYTPGFSQHVVNAYNYVTQVGAIGDISGLAEIVGMTYFFAKSGIEVDDKDHLFLLTKYADITFKTIDKVLDEDLYDKMKALGNMAKKLRELDSALSNLQSIESDLYSEFTDVFDSDPYVEEFSDLNIDQHSHEYSIKNQDIKEVFDDFFS